MPYEEDKIDEDIDKLKFPEKCDCKCHNDGRIRHDKNNICCKEPNIMMASQPCKCAEDLHVACAINPRYVIGKARITDTKYSIMDKLAKYTGCIQFGYDENNKSLDIYFKRSEHEWDYGAGIQINELTESDKDALRKYLDKGQ